MKARKTLELTFPEPFMVTLFLWDSGFGLDSYKREWVSDTVLRIQVQRRTERAEIRRDARPYGATARTIVG